MSEPSGHFPPRVHALMAASASKAVVIRRGPSKHVATFLWDTKADEITIGQWFKGRIYERRSDLSPDGKYLIYFAFKGSSDLWSWTAVSKAPYLKALDFHEKGDCWQGGGLFVGSGSYWLNGTYVDLKKNLTQQSPLKVVPDFKPVQHFGSECTGVYYPRLLRDGWKLIERVEKEKWNCVSVFEKKLHGGWVLRKIAHEQVGAPKGKSCYWDEHVLENKQENLTLNFPEWEWAEWDQNTLVWAETGLLYRSSLTTQGIATKPKLVHDFKAYTFEEIKAPY